MALSPSWFIVLIYKISFYKQPEEQQSSTQGALIGLALVDELVLTPQGTADEESKHFNSSKY